MGDVAGAREGGVYNAPSGRGGEIGYPPCLCNS
jgi:hypothetical protein